MSNTVRIGELSPPGFGTCELKGYGYIGSVYKFQVRYTYPTANEDSNPAQLLFEFALAYKWTTEPAASLAMLDAYEAVVEVKQSSWLQEISSIDRTTPEHLTKSLSE